MSTRTNSPIEQLRASLADEPEVWSRPLRLLAEALLAHCDVPQENRPTHSCELPSEQNQTERVQPCELSPGTLAYEGAGWYVARLGDEFCYLSGSGDTDIGDDWPTWPPAEDLDSVVVVAINLQTRTDVRRAIRRHERRSS